MRIFAILIVCLLAESACADGWNFKDGHFPNGKMTVLRLTEAQKKFLDLIRRCSSRSPSEKSGAPITNEYNPYFFKLTREQSAILKKEAGFSPSRFAVFESYRGDKSVDLEMNMINRFSAEEFEVSHALLTPDAEAEDWQKNIIGWLPSPFEKVNPDAIKFGKCPQASMKSSDDSTANASRVFRV